MGVRNSLVLFSVSLAVISTSPGAFAVTTPLVLTVAMEGLSVFQVIVLFVALVGYTVADKASVLLTSIVVDEGISIEIEVGRITILTA